MRNLWFSPRVQINLKLQISCQKHEKKIFPDFEGCACDVGAQK